jgi:hypothetical protein
MSLDFATSYAAIIKQEKQEDGTLLVYGKATDDAIDSDNQICDAGWLNKAMPEWFKTGGNIREQHSSIAAGVAKELDSKEDGHYITAHVVDASSVKKVEAGVLKGFSIGIRAPRVVRDNKAANGRIIDGQIVEVSLVDRPANPNAKLMLAKSDGTDVIQVEEMIEQELPATEITETPEVVAEAVTEEAVVVEEVTEEKAVEPTTKKFDQALFDTARTALAELIAVEAQELSEGHDERYSLATLMGAVQALMAWYEGEEAEGEVANPEMESIEMSQHADMTSADCKCDGCMKCASDGGCDSKMCKGCTKMGHKSDSVDKCLECGCHKPADSHGSADVTTAEMVEEKSSTTILPRIGVDGQDFAETNSEEEEDANKSALDDATISAIIEKAVKSATATVADEVKAYKDAINNLETELATANNKAAAGGPKRSVLKTNIDQLGEMLSKAAEYRAKAAVAEDKDLSRGYKELAEDFESKAKAIEIN